MENYLKIDKREFVALHDKINLALGFPDRHGTKQWTELQIDDNDSDFCLITAKFYQKDGVKYDVEAIIRGEVLTPVFTDRKLNL